MAITSIHYKKDRKERERLIKEVIGMGKVITNFVVDKGHPNGAERHEITTTGIIIVYNNRTNKMITKLIARPAQIKRYGWNPSKELIAIATDHQKKGYHLY